VSWPVGCTQWVLREADAGRAIERVAAAGYDAIELAGDPAADPVALGRAVAAAGLEVGSLCPVYSLERDCAHPDPALRRAAREYLARCVELAAALGAATVVVVPTYRVEWGIDRDAELARAAETIAAVAAGIPPGGPTLALEPLNRYETHLVRTLADAERLRAMIAHPQVAIHADLFHMHIEEDAIGPALRAHAAQLRHVHLADSQRREPGSGHLDFAAVFAALREGGYRGVLAMEFLPATDAALRAGLAHVRRLMGSAPAGAARAAPRRPPRLR
jgi:sugar phosphate isomerase/epimerase